MNRRTPFLSRLSSVGLSIVLVGCAADDMSDLKAFVDEVKQRPPGRLEPLPELKEIETFVYVGDNLRNPFAPVATEPEEQEGAPGSGPRPDPNRRREELEFVPLDSIRMVGTLEQTETTWGLVRTNDGTIHRVRSGNYLGQNHGQIMRITEGSIDLNEIIPDGRGGYRERQASLALSQ